MSGTRSKIDRLEERIENGDAVDERDRDALAEFNRELSIRTAYSDHRHEKLLRHCVRMSENVGGLADALEHKEAAKDIVAWIGRNYDNPETNRDYRVAFRVFGKLVAGDEEREQPPDSIAWVDSTTENSYDPKPDPSNMLRWHEDVIPMVDTTTNSRDAAIIAVAWDAGFRSGEFRDIRVGDLTDTDLGTRVSVDGRRGERSVLLIPSKLYLERWLEDHPAPNDPDAPLWSKLHEADELTFNSFKKILENAAEEAGVTRPVTLTNFRKSCASELASQGMSQAQLEEHHGWVRGSDIASRYVVVFSEDSDRAIAEARGIELDEEEEREPLGPIECPRCRRETHRHKDFCMRCGQALTKKAARDLEEDQKDLEIKMMELVQNEPDLAEKVKDKRELVRIIENNPELEERISEFAEEVRD